MSSKEIISEITSFPIPSFDLQTREYLNKISRQAYHHMLVKRKRTGHFITHGSMETIPGWPCNGTRRKESD